MRERLHMERIENLVGTGTPDVQGFFGEQFWVELKALSRPADKTTPIDCELDIDQVRWHRNRWRVGGRSWLLIQVGSRNQARRYLIPGYRAFVLQKPALESDLEAFCVLNPQANPRNFMKMLGK
jgi:hypothetical protein